MTDNSEQITRILFQDFPVWAVAVFYVIAAAAIIAFFYGWYAQYRKYARGQAVPGTLSNIRARLLGIQKTVWSHRTIMRRDSAAGHGHAAIFIAFTLLFIGTSTITLNEDITDKVFGFDFWHGAFYLWFSLVLDIADVALIAGLGYMMYRRGWLAPPKLDYTRPDRDPSDPDYDRSDYRIEDWAFLWSLILIGFTGLLLEAAREVWLQGTPLVWNVRWWQPFGTIIAYIFSGLGMDAGAGFWTRVALWWFHGLLALTFIALIPYTKVKHIFTAGGSLATRNPRPAAALPTVDLEADRIGYNKITDFSWKDLLNLDACTKCGRCHEACPARATGYPLSPRDLILSLRELAHDTLEGRKLPDEEALAAHGEGINQIRPETLWACRACAACVEICPVGIEHVPMIVQMRRVLVEEGEMAPMLQTALQNIQKKGNSFGESKRKRPSWTKKLDFKIKDARKEAVDVLWFVGDFASFDPRSQKVSQAFARILHAAGVDFGILFEGEMTAGNDVRRVGEEGLYDHLTESNIETLRGCEFKKMVTTDPHSFNTIKNEYPAYGGDFTIEHASAMLTRMIDRGEIELKRPLGYRVTYHDPCHLGRFNNGYDAPRASLNKLGTELVEMGRTRDNSFCCGAGGGRIWHPDPEGQEKPSENRMREAAAIDGLEMFVVNCPKCMNMFEDSVKSTGNDKSIQVKELIELIEEAMALAATEAEGETEAAPA